MTKTPEEATAYLRHVARFAAELTLAGLGGARAQRSAMLLRDTCGVVVGGSRQPESHDLVKSFLRDGSARGATVLCHGFPTLSVEKAAFLNGMAGTGIELDAGHERLRTHAPIHVLPALLAAGEDQHASGIELIVAFVLGCEVAYRFGGAIERKTTVNAHGTWGTVGAAAAVAKVLRYDEELLYKSMLLSCHFAVASLMSASRQGATVRNSYVGVSAQMALVACELARAGVSGVENVGAEVFGGLLGTAFDEDRIERDLGVTYEFDRTYTKLFACCRHLAPSLEAMQNAIGVEALEPEEVAEITVETYELAATFCEADPRSALAARFSIPYALGAQLVFGAEDEQAFEGQALWNVAVRRVAARTKVVPRRELSAAYPEQMASAVSMKLRDGRTLSGYCSEPRGGLERPHSDTELEAKFQRLVGRSVPASVAGKFSAGLADIGALNDVSEWLSTMRQES